ncbi:hypothetical protein RHGRI_021994 [Rhododendron griersonianum]|uniref:Uncharacterized protein n=1 Tax=Rhododendron griersonianum TaxID=479676 RepID=A0AAV6JM75_9ERIC|nr:hypothetical protein RHGRI_021994 [Rhododendron griersonianum]
MNLDRVDSKTDQSSRLSEDSVSKPGGGGSSEIAISAPVKAAMLQGVRDGEVKIVHHHSRSNSNIAEAVHILSTDMPYFQDPKTRPLKFWAIRLLERNPKKLDLFCDLPTSAKTMEWLAAEHEAEIQQGQTSGAPLGLLAPPPYFPPPPYE